MGVQRGIHRQLQQMVKSQEIDDQFLLKKIRSYIALMIEDNPGQQQSMFDFFCEHGGVKIFETLMSLDTLLAIKAYSLLFINLKNQMWVNFILCQPFVTAAIELKNKSGDEQQWTQYFISFLKSMSIRINISQISLFYNKKSCNFPLIYQTMKYFNHPDFMVRTSAMNIILELMKIQQNFTKQYFSRFPFTSYLITFVCEVNSLIVKYHNRICVKKMNQNNFRQQKISQMPKVVHHEEFSKQLKSYRVDLNDYLLLFNDLFQFGTAKATLLIENTYLLSIGLPIFAHFKSQQTSETKHSLLLLHQTFRFIKNSAICQVLCTLLLAPKINQNFINSIKTWSEVYKPNIFNQPFNPQKSYWDKYQTQITRHCLKVFQGLQNFDVQFEQSPPQLDSNFIKQIEEMSQNFNFDLLTSTVIGQSLYQKIKGNTQQDLIQNPYRNFFLKLLMSKNDPLSIFALQILLQIITNEYISQDILQIYSLTRLSLVPQTNNSKKTELSGILKQAQTSLIYKIADLDWNMTSIHDLSTMLLFLRISLTQSFTIDEQQQILNKYREINEMLIQQLGSQNIGFVIETFQNQYLNILKKSRNIQLQCIPYQVHFLAQDQWGETYNQHQKPPTDALLHYMRHFLSFRCFITHYFQTLYDVNYYDFFQQYDSEFKTTALKWTIGKNYHIENSTLVMCRIQNKNLNQWQKGVIIQDSLNFVLGRIQPSDKSKCIIIVNNSWQEMAFSMNKQDDCLIQISMQSKNEKIRLKFDDEIRCNTSMASIIQFQKKRYEAEQDFIVKFIKNSLQE